MEKQKGMLQSIVEIFILLKRNIFHIAYFLLTGIVIGFIYANWVMDINYQSVGKVEIRQTTNETQLIQITNAIKSEDFYEVVVDKLADEDHDTLPNGNPITTAYISSGITATYVVNNPLITVTFDSEYQELTLLTLNTIVDEFVVYGNTNLTVVNNNLHVYQNAEVATKTGLSNTMIYGLSVVLGVAFGAVVVIVTDYSSGKVLFASDLEMSGFRVYSLTKVKVKKNDELASQKALTHNILTLQNNLESHIQDRFLKTVAFSTFGRSSNVDDLIDLVAKTYALNDQKTLIVDLDLVKPDLHEKYEVENKVTIVDIAEQGLESVKFKKLQNSLYFLGGKEVTYPSKFFKSDEFRKAISTISKDFDIVLFRLSRVEEDMTNLNALDQFDFLVMNVTINRTSKKKLNEYLSVIENHKYQNVVINTFEK